MPFFSLFESKDKKAARKEAKRQEQLKAEKEEAAKRLKKGIEEQKAKDHVRDLGFYDEDRNNPNNYVEFNECCITDLQKLDKKRKPTKVQCKSVRFQKIPLGLHKPCTFSIIIDEQPRIVDHNKGLIDVIIEDNNTLTIWKIQQKKKIHLLTIDLPAPAPTIQDEEKREEEAPRDGKMKRSLRGELKQLKGWTDILNEGHFCGAQILTREEIDKHFREKEERLDREKQEKRRKEEEQRVKEEQEKQERLAREEKERLAKAEKDRIDAAAKEKERKRREELEKKEKKRQKFLERLKNNTQYISNGMASIVNRKMNLPDRLEVQQLEPRSSDAPKETPKAQCLPGLGNELRRLAANESIENVFSMFWMLPLLVIFVFWFKRYIVTRKSNDDNDIVQDDVNEDKNSLNNMV